MVDLILDYIILYNSLYVRTYHVPYLLWDYTPDIISTTLGAYVTNICPFKIPHDIRINLLQPDISCGSTSLDSSCALHTI